jgi:hypothetical protein
VVDCIGIIFSLIIRVDVNLNLNRDVMVRIATATSLSQRENLNLKDTVHSCGPCMGGGDDLTILVVVDESCQELLDETRSESFKLLLDSDDCT